MQEDWFRYAYEHSKNSLCYNGNLITRADCAAVAERYPRVESVMLGRALIGDPGMLVPEGTTSKTLKAFHRELTETYTREFGSARNAMFRLKENWHFLYLRFDGSEKLWKRLRKTTDINEFYAITDEIFDTLPLAENLRADW